MRNISCGLSSHELYSSPNMLRVIKSRRTGWTMHVAVMGDVKGAYRRSEWKRPLGRPRRRWEDNIEMDLKKWDRSMDWIYLVQNRDS
jgi:hypothetical protein